MAYFSFCDPRLDEIYRYWLSKRRDGGPPRRADIKPGELGAAIRHLNLIEVLREEGKPLAFRHRLVGTYHSDWLGRDVTGRILDETLYGPATEEIVATMTRIVETARPYRRVARLDWNNQKFVVMEAVEMPLTDETGAVAMIMRGAVFRHAAGEAGPRMTFEPLPLD